MNVMDKSDTFVFNSEKLCISLELVEIVYYRVEQNEVLHVAAINQEVKISEVKKRNYIGRREIGKKSLQGIGTQKNQ